MKCRRILALALGMILSAAVCVAEVADGTYTDFGSGRNDFIYVTTTFEGGKIASVEVGDNKETPTIAAGALRLVPERIVENNSVNVDTVSRATLSSNGIIEAVKGAIVQAGGNVSDFMTDAKTPVTTNYESEYTADVVIVGAGGSGLAAAARAGEIGLNVILLEQKSYTGGALYGTECHYTNDSIVEETFGITDNQTADVGYEYHMNYNHNQANAEMVRYFMDHVGDVINWFCAMPGNAPIAAYPSFRGAGTSSWTMTEGEGPGEAIRFQAYIDGLGVKTMTNVHADSLILDENGGVVGVQATTTDGKGITFHAKDVILATGGFVDNQEMLAEYVGANEAAASVSGGNIKAGGTGDRNGDGIRMAWAAGADKFGQEHVAYSLTTVPGFAIDTPVHRAANNPYLWVNDNAERFSNESSGFLLACKQPNGEYWCLLDTSKIDFMENNETLQSTCFTPQTKAPIANLRAILDTSVEKGMIYRADTWEALAEQIGLDAAKLVETVNTYNTYCANGEDPEFAKNPERLTPMDAEGPYYAIKMVGGMLTTTGGVKTNAQFQALNTEGGVIDGLYVVGTDCGGFYAETYNFMDSGCCSTFSFLSGSTAAEMIAAEQGVTFETIY
ncbi:MAG: FAD-binding protein [Candidatus Ventricola sp.]|nr:FAD-binding protein [Candidatus Ventricola sp.]